MDPTNFGAISSYRETLPQLRFAIEASVPKEKYPKSFSEFLDHQADEDGANRVLTLSGDTTLDGSIALDWNEPWVRKHKITAVFCPGDLTLTGDLINRNLNNGPLLLVSGNLRVNNLVKSGSNLLVLRSVHAKGIVVGEYNDGAARVAGDLHATAMFILDHDFGVYGTIHARVADLNEELLGDLLVPEVFDDEELEELNVDKLLQRSSAGLALFQN